MSTSEIKTLVALCASSLRPQITAGLKVTAPAGS